MKYALFIYTFKKYLPKFQISQEKIGIQGRITRCKIAPTHDPCNKLRQIRSVEQLVHKNHHCIRPFINECAF